MLTISRGKGDGAISKGSGNGAKGIHANIQSKKIRHVDIHETIIRRDTKRVSKKCGITKSAGILIEEKAYGRNKSPIASIVAHELPVNACLEVHACEGHCVRSRRLVDVERISDYRKRDRSGRGKGSTQNVGV